MHRDTLETVCKALVLSHLDYCSNVWDNFGKLLADTLQRFQNQAARIILGKGYDSPFSENLATLGWDTLEERRAKQKAVLMYKILNNEAPQILNDMFQQFNQMSSYNLRGSSSKLFLPRPRTESLKKSLSYKGVQQWNSLPPGVRTASSLRAFKSKLMDMTLLY